VQKVATPLHNLGNPTNLLLFGDVLGERHVQFALMIASFSQMKLRLNQPILESTKLIEGIAPNPPSTETEVAFVSQCGD
jgi:hypothetical protein